MPRHLDSQRSTSINTAASAGVVRMNDTTRSFQNRVTSILLAVTFVLACVLGAGLLLRFAVSKLNDPKPLIMEVENVRSVSRSAREKASRREIADEEIRDRARTFDKRLLERRRDRQWIYETNNLPDASDAKQNWRREVENVEKQIAEARALQSKIDAEAPEGTPDALAENSVLWHRMKYLEELREDAPADD